MNGVGILFIVCLLGCRDELGRVREEPGPDAQAGDDRVGVGISGGPAIGLDGRSLGDSGGDLEDWPFDTNPRPGVDPSDNSAVSGDGDARSAGDGEAGFAGRDAMDQPEDRYSTDGEGTPAGAEDRPWWCDQGVEREELCGNKLDDDCDGTVDEEVTIGLPCSGRCSNGRGAYACDTAEGTIVCMGLDGVLCTEWGGSFIGCGNGVRDGDDLCDYAAPDQVLGETCGRDCRPVMFPRCQIPERHGDQVIYTQILECRGSFRCVQRVGACMPSLAKGLPRCPELPMEPPLGCGNGLLDEGEECDTAVDRDCTWNCLNLVEAGDEARHPPPIPMFEVEEGDRGPVDCLVSCTTDDECPSSLPECYQGYCAVPLVVPCRTDGDCPSRMSACEMGQCVKREGAGGA